MTVLDYFVLIVVIASVASGATRGILKGIISIVSAAAGLLAAAQFYEYVAILFKAFVSNKLEADILASCDLSNRNDSGEPARRDGCGSPEASSAHVGGPLCREAAPFGLVRGWLILLAEYLALTAFPVKLAAVERATLLRAARRHEGHCVPDVARSQDQFLKGYETVQGCGSRRLNRKPGGQQSEENKNEKQAGSPGV
jgi:hypothetical protein